MSLVSKIRALYNGDEVDLQATRQRGLVVAQGLPPYTEITRQGGGYSAMTTAGVAALVVRPGTAALFTLWNGEIGGQAKSYVIDRLFAHQLVSGTAESRFGIWACLHPAGMAEPTADITAINSASGRNGYGGQAVIDVDATVADDGWFPWGPSVSVEPTGALPGAQVAPEVNGRLIVPPGAGLSLHVVASSVDEDFTVGASWFEDQLDLVG